MCREKERSEFQSEKKEEFREIKRKMGQAKGT